MSDTKRYDLTQKRSAHGVSGSRLRRTYSFVSRQRSRFDLYFRTNVRNIKSPKWIVSGLFLFEMRLAWHNIRGIISTSTNYFLAEKCALQRESK